MSGFSNYLGNAVLNWMRGTAMPAALTTGTAVNFAVGALIVTD